MGYKMLGIFLFIIIVILSAYLSFQVPTTLFIQQFRFLHESKDSKYEILIHINHPITNVQTCWNILGESSLTLTLNLASMAQTMLNTTSKAL